MAFTNLTEGDNLTLIGSDFITTQPTTLKTSLISGMLHLDTDLDGSKLETLISPRHMDHG